MSSSVETDKENDPMDDTDQLLDSTYNLGTTNAASIMGKCFRTPILITVRLLSTRMFDVFESIYALSFLCYLPLLRNI